VAGLRLLPLAAALLAWAGSSVSAQATEESSSTPSNGGVFPFLPAFIMDLGHGAFFNTASSRSQYPLTNCSDEVDFCLQSNEFKVTFPRSCERRMSFFSGGGRIVSSFARDRLHRPASPTYGYFDPEYPQYAFVLDQEGLFGIVYDPQARDLAAQLKPDVLSNTRFGQGPTFTYGRLLSLSPLFACE